MRYAIYFTPASGTDLWRFGSSVLGYDAYLQKPASVPKHALFQTERAAAWTAEPQRHGFHATLKAPFEFASGTCEGDVHDLAKKLPGRRGVWLCRA